MGEESTIIQHRLPSEGADYLLLAGVNDAHLQELARQTGCRVILRGDYLILSGELELRIGEQCLPIEMMRGHHA